MNTQYFLNQLYGLLTAQEAFPGKTVAVFKGPRSNVSGTHTMQIFPLNMREETRAEGVLECTDTFQVAGVVQTDEENAVENILALLADTKGALDAWQLDSRDISCAVLPDCQISYDTFPAVVFNLQVEIKYIRRI